MAYGYRQFLSKYLPRGAYSPTYGYSVLRGRREWVYGKYKLEGYCDEPQVYGYHYQRSIANDPYCCCDPLCGCYVFAYVGLTGVDHTLELTSEIPCCWRVRGRVELRGIDNYPVDHVGEKTICTDFTYWVFEGCVIDCEFTPEECQAVVDAQNSLTNPFNLPRLGRPGGGAPEGQLEAFCGPWDYFGQEEPGTYEELGCEITVESFNEDDQGIDESINCSRYCVDHEAALDAQNNLYWRREWAHCQLLEQYGLGAGTPPNPPTFLGETYTECFQP